MLKHRCYNEAISMIDPPSRYVNFIEHAIKGGDLNKSSGIQPMATFGGLPQEQLQPPFPHSWGMEETQRGSAPLHAPMDGTGESKLVREAWTLLDPRHPPVANCNS